MATGTANPSELMTIEEPGPLSASSLIELTTEEMLALPDGEVDRELFLGQLREHPMTTRNVPHSFLNGRIGYVLNQWNEDQPEPRGLVLVGEARVRIRRDPDTTVGIDVAYLSPELAAQTPEGAKFVDGPPTLAVEILSPSDTIGAISEKIRAYLDAGVPLVWIVDPTFRTIVVHRPDGHPRLFHMDDTTDAEPHLPGFRVALARLFVR